METLLKPQLLYDVLCAKTILKTDTYIQHYCKLLSLVHRALSKITSFIRIVILTRQRRPFLFAHAQRCPCHARRQAVPGLQYTLLCIDNVIHRYVLMCSIILVEMLNIVGERERPNLGFARDVRDAQRTVSAQLSFREARQIYLSPLHAYCILPER